MAATPTVYFIDDSATMREVIKIAFRRENINVVAYNDAATALGQIEITRPDIVITDVIMPDKDGYEVCQFVKQHPLLSKTPVILMSGVVNRAVAEKAFSVKADELIRKPFQPQDLITRVKHLLSGAAGPAMPQPSAPPPVAASALSSIFQQAPAKRPVASTPAFSASSVPASAMSAPVAAFAASAAPTPTATPPAPASRPPAPAAAPVSAPAPAPDVQRLKFEVMRLEGLVKKLQSELQTEREYSKSLEEQMRAQQDSRH